MSDHIPASKLDAIFKPSSIAVVGASTRPGTVGNDIFRNLLFNEFHGSVYPINPKAARRYREKFGVMPDTCYVNNAALAGGERPGEIGRRVGARDAGEVEPGLPRELLRARRERSPGHAPARMASRRLPTRR